MAGPTPLESLPSQAVSLQPGAIILAGALVQQQVWCVSRNQESGLQQ